MPIREGVGRVTSPRVRPVAGPRPAVPAEAGLVGDLLQALDDAVTRLEPHAQKDARDVLQLLRASREQVQATARAMGPSRGQPGPAVWRHDLRMHVAAMAGWAVVLCQQREEATRLRAKEAIERNAKALSGLLAHPPAA